MVSLLTHPPFISEEKSFFFDITLDFLDNLILIIASSFIFQAFNLGEGNFKPLINVLDPALKFRNVFVDFVNSTSIRLVFHCISINIKCLFDYGDSLVNAFTSAINFFLSIIWNCLASIRNNGTLRRRDAIPFTFCVVKGPNTVLSDAFECVRFLIVNPVAILLLVVIDIFSVLSSANLIFIVIFRAG